MAGGTTHHCPRDSHGKCDRTRGANPYCKTHQTLCPKPSCKGKSGFVKTTDPCPRCGWKHPDHVDFQRAEKANNAMAKKAEHEAKLKAAAEKKTAAAKNNKR